MKGKLWKIALPLAAGIAVACCIRAARRAKKRKGGAAWQSEWY